MSLFPRTLRLITSSTIRSAQIRHAHAAIREDEPESSRINRENAARASRYRKPLPDDPEPGEQSASRPSPSEPVIKGKGKARDPASENYRFPTRGPHGGPPGPFDVLGLSRSASQAEIKSQYYRLALLLHPDSSHPSSSPANFATLNRAYKLLSTPSSRQDYLQTNYGWSADGRATPELDPMMAELLRRKRDGAGQRFRGDAGRGAWGTYGPDGRWRAAEQYPADAGEPRFMSHSSFGSMLLFLTFVLGWIQYHRISMLTETRREYLDSQHMDASHALQQARDDAKKYGPMRMEAIQRRVNELQVMKELAKQEAEAEVRAEAMRGIAPPPVVREAAD